MSHRRTVNLPSYGLNSEMVFRAPADLKMAVLLVFLRKDNHLTLGFCYFFASSEDVCVTPNYR